MLSKAPLIVLFLATLIFSASLSFCITPQASRTLIPGEANSNNVSTANIVVAKIENGCLYAADGRKFEMTSSTKVAKRYRAGKIRTAELVFQNGSLVAITLK